MGIAMVECCTNQGFQSVLPYDGQNNEFWYYCLKHNKHEILRRASGSTFLEINKSEFQKLPVSAPHPDEQKKIAEALRSVDDKIQAVSNNIDLTEEFKKGLLQQLFA